MTPYQGRPRTRDEHAEALILFADHARDVLDGLLEAYENGDQDQMLKHAEVLDLDARVIMRETACFVDYDVYLNSFSWAGKAMHAKRLADHKCHLCHAIGKEAGGDAVLHAHHATYRRKGMAREIDDLVVLCADCHARHHGKPESNRWRTIWPVPE